MSKLDFEYNTHNGNETAEYKGYTIKAIQDSDAENPWEAWDCQPPIAIKGNCYDKVYSEEYGNPLDPIEAFSDGQLNRHWKKINEKYQGAIDYGFGKYAQDLDALVFDLLSSWTGTPKRPEKGDLVAARREVLGEFMDDCDFDDLVFFWNLIGINALSTTSRGYSQGDWCDILIVHTPEVLKSWGQKKSYYKKTYEKQLQNAADLYGSWAWGNTYGYVIENSDGDEIDDGSCWGFYGSDHNESGLAEQAMNAVDCDIRWNRKKKNNRLKQLIKNKVPLSVRKAELTNAVGL